MSSLLEIIFDLLTTWLPWPSGREDSRSIVGESDLDRRARRLWISVVTILLVLGSAIVLGIYFRG